MKDLDHEVKKGRHSFWSWWPTVRSDAVNARTEAQLKEIIRRAFMCGWIRRSQSRDTPKEWR